MYSKPKNTSRQYRKHHGERVRRVPLRMGPNMETKAMNNISPGRRRITTDDSTQTGRLLSGSYEDIHVERITLHNLDDIDHEADGELSPLHTPHNEPLISDLSPRATKYLVDSTLPNNYQHLDGIVKKESLIKRYVNQQAGTVRASEHVIRAPGFKYPDGTVRSYKFANGTLREYKITDGNQTMQGKHHLPDGTLRGMNVPNGTIRGPGHTTTLSRHRYKSSRDELYSTPQPFRRTTTERKENSISYFGIELDKSDRHSYLPGEEISGKVEFDINQKMEVRFIELIIIGMGNLTMIRGQPDIPLNKREIFVNKRSYIIGTADARWTSLITPGHYVSKFKFALPENLPSTIRYDDQLNGITMDIAYMVKARICDDVGSSSARSTHSINNFVKVLLSRRQMFIVRRPFDMHSIPGGLNPVMHTEEVMLFCTFFAGDRPAAVTLNLDRYVFIAGDDIKIRLETSSRDARRIRRIACNLEQMLLVRETKTRASITLVHVQEKFPQGFDKKHGHGNTMIYDIIIPTTTNFLPSVLTGCKMLHASYKIVVKVKFSSCGGKLIMEVPIAIGPCISPVLMEKSRNSVPLFNRPLRFPKFNSNSNPELKNLHSSQSIKVDSHFSPTGCASIFCCCLDNDIA